MKKIIDYHTTESCSGICTLAEEIRERILEGWQPYGNPYVATYFKDRDDARVIHCQAMVKYEDE